MADESGSFAVPGSEAVSWVLDCARGPVGLLVLAHGAGADMNHGTMVSLACAIAARGIDVLRFNFPFMQAGRRRVDSKAVATATIAAAVAEGRARSRAGKLLLGGHSFGGRMASHAVIDHNLAVDGLVFCAYPLHPAGKPGVERAEHLPRIDMPMLFLSGTRDALATSDLLRGVVEGLGRRAHLHWLDTADHGYKVQKRLRARSDSVFEEMAEQITDFAGKQRK